MAFVKLDSGILHSTLWVDRPAREVFITALLMAEPHELEEPEPALQVRSLDPLGFDVPPGWYGFVAAAGTGIVRFAGLDNDEGLGALERLASPDPESRTPDYEGRRMVRVDGGYIVLNFDKYRRKDHTAAERMQRYRDRKSVKPLRVTPGTLRVTDRNVTHAEAEVHADKEEEKKIPPPSPPADKPPKVSLRKSRLTREQCVALAKQHKLPDRDGHWFFDSMESGGWMRGKNAIRDAEAHFRSYVTGCWLPSLQGTDGPGAKPVPKYFSQTGPKERALKEREKQLRDALPDDAATAAMLAKLAEKFPTQRT